ncbi:hypothetical protein L9F63_004055 [Diploptera punctata]|uniref:Gustatory receptor n=1 Tax=Diploptera punctata TaxID=6984 RepID=A0AAD7ZGT9_DIPPU|nr:hypothetical protein L9F63_004055 [Diploptera punctata]
MAKLYTFSSSVKPLYYLLQILGLSSLSLSKLNTFVQINLLWKIYNILVLTMLIFFGSCAAFERLNQPGLKATAVFGEILTMVIGAFKSVTAVFLCTIVNNTKNENLISKILAIDSFLFVNPNNLYRKTFIFILLQVLLVYIYVIVLFLFDIFVWNVSLQTMTLWCLLTGYPHRIVNMACVIQFCDFVLLLKDRLHVLNLKMSSTIKDIVEKTPINISKLILPNNSYNLNKSPDYFQLKENIHNIRKCYDISCDITELINNTHGTLLFIELVLAGIELTLALYFLLSTILGRTEIHHIFKLISLTAPCRAVINEYETCVMLVQKLLLEDLNDEATRELKLFAEQLFHRRIKFTALNFLHIDYTVLFTIFGAVTTYLVFALQYR